MCHRVVLVLVRAAGRVGVGRESVVLAAAVATASTKRSTAKSKTSTAGGKSEGAAATPFGNAAGSSAPYQRRAASRDGASGRLQTASRTPVPMTYEDRTWWKRPTC